MIKKGSLDYLWNGVPFSINKSDIHRAWHIPGGTIVLSLERTERSRTIPSFRKKTNA